MLVSRTGPFRLPRAKEEALSTPAVAGGGGIYIYILYIYIFIYIYKNKGGGCFPKTSFLGTARAQWASVGHHLGSASMPCSLTHPLALRCLICNRNKLSGTEGNTKTKSHHSGFPMPCYRTSPCSPAPAEMLDFVM